jgi:hypothetical protein
LLVQAFTVRVEYDEYNFGWQCMRFQKGSHFTHGNASRFRFGVAINASAYTRESEARQLMFGSEAQAIAVTGC